MSFRLTLTNNTDVTATAGTVRDTFDPARLIWVGATPTEDASASGVATFTVGDIAPLGSETIDVTFTAGTTDGLADNVVIAQAGGDSDTDTETVEIITPDIDVTKTRTSADATVTPGADVSFRLTLTNNTDVTATAGTVRDTFDPARLIWVGATPTEDASASGVATFTVGDIAPLGSETIDVTFTAGTTDGLADNVVIAQAGGDSDTDTETVEIITPDIDVTKTRTSADATVTPGAACRSG